MIWTLVQSFWCNFLREVCVFVPLCFYYFFRAPRFPTLWQLRGIGGRGIKRSLENAASQSLLLGRSRDEGFLAEKVIRSVSPTHGRALGFAVFCQQCHRPKPQGL